jgi:hypothetical protein
MSEPDLRLGKIFYALWLFLLLFLPISCVLYYMNISKDCASLAQGKQPTEKKKKDNSNIIMIAIIILSGITAQAINNSYKLMRVTA